jgi:TrmH family RNA methyltransferase
MVPNKLEVFEISNKELDRISMLKTPNQVLALVSIPGQTMLKPSAPDDLTLVLDEIKDPGNLGTIIRTADWFGIKKIICSENCVEIYNPKVIQATMGSIARVEVIYANLVSIFSELPKGVKIYGTVLDGKNIYKTELRQNSYLVIGSESHGISKEIMKYITDFITIPTYAASSAQAESLNASIATAISFAEFRRQSK